jgi:starch phosphorylase
MNSKEIIEKMNGNEIIKKIKNNEIIEKLNNTEIVEKLMNRKTVRKIKSKEINDKMDQFIRAYSGKRLEGANNFEQWMALSRTIMERIAPDWYDSMNSYKKKKQAHYFSAEFLMGRSLMNNLMNLDMLEEARQALSDMGTSLEQVEEQENDPGLGNGGLGRLAACFLDSCATMNLPVTGYGILYRFGLFRQEIENGFQKEYPDTWREKGYPWLIRRDELRVKIDYNDITVFAVPYDMPVVGCNTKNVNTLRLWKAEPAVEFDFNLFNSQRFDDAVIVRNRVNDIWRVLYPNDTTYDGKVLRVRQQYFFVSASLQDIIRSHKESFGDDLSNFAQYHSIQLNDTHPVIGIPELMRLLTTENGVSWEDAWKITSETFAYTNHTVLAEALEKWDIGIFEYLFKDLYPIIERINSQFRDEMTKRGLSQELINFLAPIGDGKVRMAWLAVYGSFSVNGVAKLHTQILKDDILKDWYRLFPEKFNSKTNGVTPRRWLKMSNPELSGLITELLGSEKWVTDLGELARLKPLTEDIAVMKRFIEIKNTKKKQLAVFLKKYQGVDIDTGSLFDVQIKRLHEYKRQLLNAIAILDMYFDIKANPDKPRVARTFIFGAKAAPGYFRAKGIIKLINEIAALIDRDKNASKYIKVVFVKNYNVSIAEKMFPAADISAQLSTAGLEASGTGNMKFMMNGVITNGTYDGANVEIVEAAGFENNFIFGARVEHFAGIRTCYNPLWQYENIPGLKRALDALIDGTLDDGHTGAFRDIYNSLLHGSSWQPADTYYILGDFEDFRNSRKKIDELYKDQIAFAQMSWINLCSSGGFSSDRTIKQYADEIWKIEPEVIQ